MAGEREGLWRVHVNDHVEEGRYLAGQKHGKWIHTYGSGKREFEGSDLGNPWKTSAMHPNGVLKKASTGWGQTKEMRLSMKPESSCDIFTGMARCTKPRFSDKRRDGKLKGN